MVDKIILTTQLPTDGWVESTSLRPNGQMLMTRLDQPELWTVDPDNLNAEPHHLHTFPDTNGLVHIVRLRSKTEEYAVLAGKLDLTTVKFTHFHLWRVSFSSDDPTAKPTVTEMPQPGDLGMGVGMIPISERVMILADSGYEKHCIWRMDITTGEKSVLVQHDMMQAKTAEDFFGLNRMRIVGGFLWFTNSSKGILCRVPIEIDGDDVRATGPVTLVCDELDNCDGLVVSEDMKTVYANAYQDGLLWCVDVDPATGKGVLRIIREDLLTPTCLDLSTADGETKLYVVCCGQSEKMQVGWVQGTSEADKELWQGMAALSTQVTVEVTTETH